MPSSKIHHRLQSNCSTAKNVLTRWFGLMNNSVNQAQIYYAHFVLLDSKIILCMNDRHSQSMLCCLDADKVFIYRHVFLRRSANNDYLVNNDDKLCFDYWRVIAFGSFETLRSDNKHEISLWCTRMFQFARLSMISRLLSVHSQPAV